MQTNGWHTKHDSTNTMEDLTPAQELRVRFMHAWKYDDEIAVELRLSPEDLAELHDCLQAAPCAWQKDARVDAEIKDCIAMRGQARAQPGGTKKVGWRIADSNVLWGLHSAFMREFAGQDPQGADSGLKSGSCHFAYTTRSQRCHMCVSSVFRFNPMAPHPSSWLAGVPRTPPHQQGPERPISHHGRVHDRIKRRRGPHGPST